MNEFLEEATKPLYQLALDIIKDLGKKTFDEFKVRKAIHKYAQNYLSRYGKVKVLGMSEPLNLSEIFTYVNFKSISYLNIETHIADLEDSFRKDRGHYGPVQPINGVKVANDKNKLNILGAPGSGKSTFLRHLGMVALQLTTKKELHEDEELYRHQCIPVLIELKRLRDTEDISLYNLIAEEFEIAGFPESGFFVERGLKAGKFLILLDGMDEVPTKIIDAVITHIKDFTDKYKDNRFVTSCRTAFYKTYLQDFTDVEISSFDNQQISKFIENWFNKVTDKEAGTSDRFNKMLFNPNNIATLELARTPLLLTFLCITFDVSQKLPANRSSLYRRALLILLERWAAEKRIHNEDIYQGLSAELEIEMLAELAANFFIENKIFFYQSELQSGIKKFVESTLNVKNLSGSKILEAIEIQQGLLIQRAPEIYSFSHLTIQEYLTSQYFIGAYKTRNLVENYIFEPRWREVFLLLAGSQSSDDLLLLMNECLKKKIIEDKLLRETICWLNQLLTFEEDKELLLSKRIFLASLVLRFKRYDSGFSQSTDRLELVANRFLSLLNQEFYSSTMLKDTINKKQAKKLLGIVSTWKGRYDDISDIELEIDALTTDMPLNKMIMGSRHKYRKSLLAIVYKHLGINDEIGFARKNEYTGLVNYLEGSLLLLECKNAALKVSRNTWDEILSSILCIPS